MKTRLTWSLGGVVTLAMVAAVATPSTLHGADFRKRDAPHYESQGDAQSDIIISLPYRHRLSEAIDEEGHQPWRADPKFAAMVELRDFVRGGEMDKMDDDESFVVVDEGIDAAGRPTATVEKSLPTGSWDFSRARATLYLFQNEGHVWIATRIVIHQLPDPPHGR